MPQTSSNPFAVYIKPSVGAQGIPPWVPPPGQFANISLNTLSDVRPTGWPTSDAAGPFANWSGAVLAYDFSNLGAYIVHGSGHLSPGAPLWAGVWCFDLDTLRWIGRNVPSGPLLEASTSVTFNNYGEVSAPQAIVGHTYPPHTYDGLAYRSLSKGGGVSGSLVRFFYPGGSAQSTVHQFDLSSPSAPPTRVVDTIQMEGGNNYSTSAVDEARGGVWLLTANGVGPLKFVKFSDWSVTNYPNISYNDYGDHSLVYLPAPFDCLIGMGRSGVGGVEMAVWVCPIVGNVPQGFTKATQSGTPPADRRCGGVWSTILNCIVSYEAAGSRKVHRLTPPSPPAISSGTWAWTSETLIGADGIAPSKNAVADNGAWGRFIEVVAARCFIFCDGVQQPVQAWRLAGM
jgi:hypothetical protein